jgi:hypothetical protein
LESGYSFVGIPLRCNKSKTVLRNPEYPGHPGESCAGSGQILHHQTSPAGRNTFLTGGPENCGLRAAAAHIFFDDPAGFMYSFVGF